MDNPRIVTFDEPDLVPFTLDLLADMLVGCAAEDGRARNLISVQMKDRQDGAVACGIQKLDTFP